MERYRKLVAGYVHWFLIRHKLVANEAACAEAARMIWNELMTALPDKITGEWIQGGKSFPSPRLLRAVASIHRQAVG